MPPAGSAGVSDDDTFTLFLLAALTVPALIGAAWAGAGDWMVAHSILVTPAQAIITIPGTAAGLDLPRLMIAATGVAVPLVWGLWHLHTSRKVEEDKAS